MDIAVHDQLRAAGRAIAAAGLSDAFGHVSVRTAPLEALITPPVPLGSLRSQELIALSLDLTGPIPAAAPREAWLHVALLAAHGLTGSVCRAQPPAVAALAALNVPFPQLTGHAAMLGTVAFHDDSRLIRDLESAQEVVAELGDGSAIVLRGNGAVTRAADPASAVAAMWVLERSAETALRALAAGVPRELPADEASWWRERAPELLPRIAAYLIPDGEENP